MCESVKVNRGWLTVKERRDAKAGRAGADDADEDEADEGGGEDWSGDGAKRPKGKKLEAKYEYGCMLCMVM